MSNFPFTIGDVARLCHLNISRENQTSEYIVCPFCGRKKMNLHYGKGLYHCPACDAGGSMLKLYAELRGFQGSKGEIVKEIKKELGIADNYCYRFARQSENAEVIVQPQVDFERMKRLDSVYRAFLNKLFLASVHKPYLYNRGLSDEDIERFGFKSMPLFGYKALCRELLLENICLENAGGFYMDDGEWTINLNPKMTGYMIPVYNYFGFIEGIQIRLDRPFGKTKYLWFSSNGLDHGTSTAAIPIYIKGRASFEMPISSRFSNGHPLTSNDVERITAKLTVTGHAKARMIERGLFSDDMPSSKIKEAVIQYIKNSFCSFYNTDGSCTIGIDNNHYFIIDYDYLAGGYSVRTYAEKSANGYTVTDKQRLARGEKG